MADALASGASACKSVRVRVPLSAYLRKWLQDSGCFEESNESNDLHRRYELDHVCTPPIFKEKMGYHLTDLFIPIVTKLPP